MPDGQMRPVDRPPTLWIALGRRRVGKTALLNTAVQYYRGSRHRTGRIARLPRKRLTRRQNPGPYSGIVLTGSTRPN